MQLDLKVTILFINQKYTCKLQAESNYTSKTDIVPWCYKWYWVWDGWIMDVPPNGVKYRTACKRDSSIKLLVKLQNLVLFADLPCSSTLMMTALDVVETVMSPGQAQKTTLCFLNQWRYNTLE